MKINLPDQTGRCVVTETSRKIAFARILYDESPLNPLQDFDAMGEILSNLRNYAGSHDRHVSEADFQNPDAVVLDRYEHGQCLWYVQDSQWVPDKQWDNTSCAGLWIPDKALLDEAKDLTGEERRAKMREWAAEACNIWTQYCNGEVYGYDIQVYKKRRQNGHVLDELRDYRYDEPLFQDSCWGFYGWDAVKEAAEEAAGRV